MSFRRYFVARNEEGQTLLKGYSIILLFTVLAGRITSHNKRLTGQFMNATSSATITGLFPRLQASPYTHTRLQTKKYAVIIPIITKKAIPTASMVYLLYDCAFPVKYTALEASLFKGIIKKYIKMNYPVAELRGINNFMTLLSLQKRRNLREAS